jgi:sec-independent protein translocase protein TatA
VIGLPEILVLLVIILIVFGAYKRLPALGRSAGKGVRVGGEKAKEFAGVARQKADGIDTKNIANQAGRGLREAKELKQAITDPAPDKQEKAAKAESPSSKPQPTGDEPAESKPAQDGT